MAHKKHHHHKNWFKAILKDAEHLGSQIEHEMAVVIKDAVKGTEFAAKFLLLPSKEILKLYKRLASQIKEKLHDIGYKNPHLDEVDTVLNHQEAAIKIAKKKGPDMMLIAGVLVIVVIIVVIIKSSKK